jgi:hypothetical protein
MESEWREYDRDYWDQRGGFDPLQAVLDEKDRPGRKNRYVDIVRPWLNGTAARRRFSISAVVPEGSSRGSPIARHAS